MKYLLVFLTIASCANAAVEHLTTKADYDKAAQGKHYACAYFYSPSCHLCRRTARDWTLLENDYKEDHHVMIASINCESESGRELCYDKGVKGWPAFKCGHPYDLEEYEGERDHTNFKQHVEKNKPGSNVGEDTKENEDDKDQVNELHKKCDELERKMKHEIQEIKDEMNSQKDEIKSHMTTLMQKIISSTSDDVDDDDKTPETDEAPETGVTFIYDYKNRCIKTTCHEEDCKCGCRNLNIFPLNDMKTELLNKKAQAPYLSETDATCSFHMQDLLHGNLFTANITILHGTIVASDLVNIIPDDSTNGHYRFQSSNDQTCAYDLTVEECDACALAVEDCDACESCNACFGTHSLTKHISTTSDKYSGLYKVVKTLLDDASKKVKAKRKHPDVYPDGPSTDHIVEKQVMAAFITKFILDKEIDTELIFKHPFQNFLTFLATDQNNLCTVSCKFNQLKAKLMDPSKCSATVRLGSHDIEQIQKFIQSQASYLNSFFLEMHKNLKGMDSFAMYAEEFTTGLFMFFTLLAKRTSFLNVYVGA